MSGTIRGSYRKRGRDWVKSVDDGLWRPLDASQDHISDMAQGPQPCECCGRVAQLVPYADLLICGECDSRIPRVTTQTASL